MAFSPVDLTLEVAEQALDVCDYNDRDEWTLCGMALKAEFGDSAFDVFDRWSSQYGKYKPATVKAVWKSFKGNQVGIGSLIHKAKENGFKFEKREISPEERARLEAERAEKVKERQKLEAIEEKKRDEYCAKLTKVLTDAVNNSDAFSWQGKCEYLDKKQIGAFGVLFPNRPLVIVHDQEKDDVRLIAGHEDFTEFMKVEKDDRPVHRIVRAGAMMVPLYDENFNICNLQVIYNTGTKRFLKGARKQGNFHIVGSIPQAGRFNVAFAEGYANAASIHMALSCPVVVCFDAGNIKPVTEKIKKLCGDRINQYLFCADDDSHLKENKGYLKAKEAASLVDGLVILPKIDVEQDEDINPIDESFDGDALYPQAVDFVIENQKVSNSAIQRHLRVGYNRACHIVDQMQNNRIVSPPSENGRRTVLVKKEKIDQ